MIDFNHSFEVAEECGWNNIADVCDLNWHTLEAETGVIPEERPKPKNAHMKIDISRLREALNNI